MRSLKTRLQADKNEVVGDVLQSGEVCAYSFHRFMGRLALY
jgi:hypothetical protein